MREHTTVPFSLLLTKSKSSHDFTRRTDAFIKVDNEVRDQDRHLRNITGDNFNQRHVAAIAKYTDGEYRGLNEALIDHHRSGEAWKKANPMSDWHQELHESLTSAYDHAVPADHDIHVYSGMSAGNMQFNTTSGSHFKTHAYTSTSIDPRIAHNFASDHEDEIADWDEGSVLRECHIAHFVIPKKHNGWLYVAPHSSHSSEHEILLPPGIKAEHHKSEVLRGDTEQSSGRAYTPVTHIHTFHLGE
jgi:hypothetical protein